MAGRPEPEGWTQTCWDDYGGLTQPEIAKLWDYIKENPSFWYSLPTLISRNEADEIRWTATQGNRVYFATNRRLPGAYENTTAWLSTVIGITQGLVITKRKGEFCRCVDADYYIDDKSENVDCAIWLTDGKTKAFVRDSPTNRGQYAPHSSKAGRVHSISEFLEEINREI